MVCSHADKRYIVHNIDSQDTMNSHRYMSMRADATPVTFQKLIGPCIGASTGSQSTGSMKGGQNDVDTPGNRGSVVSKDRP